MHKVLFISICVCCLIACQKEEVITPPDTMTDQLPEKLEALTNIFDGEGVGAALNLNGVNIFFNGSGTRYAWYENGIIFGVKDLKAPDSHFRDLPFDAIGASGVLTDDPRGKNKVIFINHQGDLYLSGNITAPNSFGQYANPDLFEFNDATYTFHWWGEDGSCPFLEVTAMLGYDYNRQYGAYWRLLVEKSGERITVWNEHNEFLPVHPSSDLKLLDSNAPEQDQRLNMAEVGAMTRVGNDYLIFSLDGTRLKVSSVFYGFVSMEYSLY